MLNHRLRFYQAGEQVVASLVGDNLKRAIGELVQLAAEDADSQSASFYVVDWRQGVLKPFVTYQLPEDFVVACGYLRVGDQCCGRAVQFRKPWVVSDMLTDPLFASARKAAEVSPIRAGFSVPVTDGDDVCLGALGCHYVEPRTPSLDQIQRNQLWASMISHTLSQYRKTEDSGGAMVSLPKALQHEDERWRVLCRRIIAERDPAKFERLVKELDSVLNDGDLD